MKSLSVILILSLAMSSLAKNAEGDFLNTSSFEQNTSDEVQDSKIIKEYPGLKKFLFQPPTSDFYIGFGVSPLGLVGEKYSPSVSLFQFHYINKFWDVELFSASLGRYFSSNEYATGAMLFNARMSPKFKIFRNLFGGSVDVSLGPLVALELIRFENIDVQIFQPDPNSTAGEIIQSDPEQPVKLSQYSFVFGASLSQTFNLKNGNKFKVTQSFYKQTYDVEKTGDWTYRSPQVGTDPDYVDVIQDPAIREEIEKASVIMFEFSYLY